jgi:malonyl-CoA O-methyltransferase
VSTLEDDGAALDQSALTRAFNRAAPSYDAAAAIQRQARAELLQRLEFFNLEPRCVLDLGAGTCHSTLELAGRYPRSLVIAADIADRMLAQAPRHRWRRMRFGRVCADAYALPFAAHSVDLIYCNLMLQWCDRLHQAFTELARVLRPGGLLLFSSFATATLEELRGAWAGVDQRPHVHEFASLTEVAEALTRSGFVEPVIDVERQTRHYATVPALMRELKQIGAQNAARGRARGLGGRALFAAVCAAYEPRREPAGIPATWELLFGAAFAGDRAHERRASADYTVPIASVGRRRLDPSPR